MSKIVFFSIPAHGHINPTLGVISELVRRGNEVWFYASNPKNRFSEKIKNTGANFVSCDPYIENRNLDLSKYERNNLDMESSIKLLVDTTLAVNDSIYREIEELKPDCIVADSMAIWGKHIADKLNIPFISSKTTFAFNDQSRKTMKGGISDLFKLIKSLSKTKKYIKKLQDKGYNIKSVMDIIKNDNDVNTIVYTSPEFQPYSETFSDKYLFAGPSLRKSRDEIKKENDRLIYISMGTVVKDLEEFYKNCLIALGDTRYQVIISAGEAVDINRLGCIPDNITIKKSVDQIAVLEKADAFISHCGMNSVNESLYCKVPLVMYPQTAEEEGIANRVEELKAGVFLKGTDINSILRGVEEVIFNNEYAKNAGIISDGFKRCPGVEGAADKILDACNK